MNRAVMLCTVTTLAALLGGCGGPSAAPTPTPNAKVQQVAPRETNETLADKGKQMYSGYQAPASDRQVPTDLRNSQSGTTTRSAHAMAYELESMGAVQGAAVLIKGRDAYVGVRVADGQRVGADEQKLIVAKLRQMDPALRQIYVTTDSWAVQVLSAYTDALEQARPLQAHEKRFAEVEKTVWPNGANR